MAGLDPARYERLQVDTNGALLATLANPDPAMGDAFGFSVSGVGGDMLLVGALIEARSCERLTLLAERLAVSCGNVELDACRASASARSTRAIEARRS